MTVLREYRHWKGRNVETISVQIKYSFGILCRIEKLRAPELDRSREGLYATPSMLRQPFPPVEPLHILTSFSNAPSLASASIVSMLPFLPILSSTPETPRRDDLSI